MPCRTFGSFHHLDASSILPSHSNHKCLQTLLNASGEQNSWLRSINLGIRTSLRLSLEILQAITYLRIHTQTSTMVVRGSFSNQSKGHHLVSSLLPQKWPLPKAWILVPRKSISFQNLSQIMAKKLSGLHVPLVVNSFHSNSGVPETTAQSSSLWLSKYIIKSIHITEQC